MSSEKLVELKDRIKYLRESLNYRKSEFADILKISRSYITDIEKGKNKNISDKLAELIKLQFNVNPRWLLTGEGEMFVEPKAKLQKESKDNFISVPVYSFAGAGNFIDITEYKPIEEIVIPACFFKKSIMPIKIKGHSMEPTIFDGAIVGVDKNDKEIVSGEVYAVWLDYEGAVIKRVHVSENKLILKSDNKNNYPDIEVEKDKISQHFIIGRVRWIMQKI